MITNYNGFGGSGGLEEKSSWLEGAAVLDELVWLHRVDVIHEADGIDGSDTPHGIDGLGCPGLLDGRMEQMA